MTPDEICAAINRIKKLRHDHFRLITETYTKEVYDPALHDIQSQCNHEEETSPLRSDVQARQCRYCGKILGHWETRNGFKVGIMYDRMDEIGVKVVEWCKLCGWPKFLHDGNSHYNATLQGTYNYSRADCPGFEGETL